MGARPERSDELTAIVNTHYKRHSTEMLLFASVFEGGLLLVAFAAGWFAGINPLGTASRDWIAVLAGLAAVVPMLALLYWGLHHPGSLAGKVTLQARDFVVRYLGGIGLVGFALISILAGLGEEALFRGLIQTLVAQHSNAWAGLLIASVLFGLAHAVSRAYALVAAIIGVWLGLLYIYTGNVVAPIVCHAVYDFIALVWLVRWKAV